jgi:hypothetical protein
MAYKNKFGITKIVDKKRDNLSVSFDTGTRRIKKDEVGVVFLYTPDMDTQEHYHIELNRQEASLLKDWLEAFLNEPNNLARYNEDLNLLIQTKKR